jgi:CRP-like cAMP-binding protein
MAATITRLVTKRDQITEADGQELRRLVAEYPGLSDRLRGELIVEIDRRTASKNGWTFVMLSPEQNDLVVDWLSENSTRPLVATRLWAKLFKALRTDTGEIVMTREELAEAVKIAPKHISEIMGELEQIGAITRRRQRVAGLRGPGMVRYFMNPRIGTHLTGAARDNAQEEAPLLKLLEGGKSDA